jgi:hypothetical protein
MEKVQKKENNINEPSSQSFRTEKASAGVIAVPDYMASNSRKCNLH